MTENKETFITAIKLTFYPDGAINRFQVFRTYLFYESKESYYNN